ncbi:MAG TPA: hypothetical protein VN181_01055 [Thermoanaerobaculia bacterium]|nr:hypothetical protein [Thermoanaerobaculia bacterium]
MLNSRASRIVAAGFLIRAFAGQALFWISWLELPIARSLQLGNGLWFFALDGAGYMRYAASLSARQTYPSHAFVEVLALFVAVFGNVASVAILLNCAAYLAMCALVVRLPHSREARDAGVLFPLAALSFAPALILWSLQPLKDTYFFLLMTAMVWLSKRWSEAPRVPIAAAMLIVMYELTGVRWYVGVIMWAAFAIFIITNRHRARTLLLFLLLATAVRLGGANDLPAIPRHGAATVVIDARRGFEATPGATTIAPATPSAAATAPPTPAAAVRIGFAAAFLPRFLGLVHIGGGRGLWVFAEIDTLAFDAVLVFAIVYSIRNRRRITPLFVFVLVVFVALAGPMIYTVTNFGTLFRLRGMLYVLAALLPLALAPRDAPQ